MAMDILVRAGELSDTPYLIDVASAHLSSCYYNSMPSLDFVAKLRAMDAKVRIPTTLNAVSPSACLFHAGRAGLISKAHPVSRFASGRGQRGDGPLCRPGRHADFHLCTLSTDPSPKLDQDIAWAESSAVIYANSVIGARTNKYSEFVDISAAVTGRAPFWGLHRPLASDRAATMDAAASRTAATNSLVPAVPCVKLQR